MIDTSIPCTVIFGASGFIGSHLIRRLASNKGSRIVAFDMREPRHRTPGVEYHIGDVRDLGSFHIQGPIERIYNLAAVHTTPGHRPYEYYETNIAGAVEVTRFAERNHVSSIIFTSSISVYGPGEDLKSESTEPKPESDYGHSKLLAELVHKQWLERDVGRRLQIIRPAVVFGPFEGGNFTRLAGLLRRGFFIYPGRKDTIKSCIYVEDLIDAMCFADAANQRFVLLNGCYEDRVTLEQIVGSLIEEYFPSARTFLVPRIVLTSIATLLRPVNFLDIGIHPDRVMKLVRSTNIYPEWLVANGFRFPTTLKSVFGRWYTESGGTFK